MELEMKRSQAEPDSGVPGSGALSPSLGSSLHHSQIAPPEGRKVALSSCTGRSYLLGNPGRPSALPLKSPSTGEWSRLPG